MKKIIVMITCIVILVLIGGYFYLFQGHRNIEKEQATLSIDSRDLVFDFLHYSDSANLKYLNKVIEIRGKVTDVQDSTLVLDSIVFCSFNDKIDLGIIEKSIHVKGRCIGFDELFGEVKFDQCKMIEQ